jgi:leucine-rich repeat protein SHOC2
LPRRYWTKSSNWKAEWLLDEYDSSLREILIEELGYEKICTEFHPIVIDTWRDYTLLKISIQPNDRNGSSTKPIVLLKIDYQFSGNKYIFRVPAEMISAEEASSWVNHGIYPNELAA